VVVVEAGGGGGSRGAGMGMMGMLRRHIPCSSSSRARAAGVWTRFGGSQSRHARPGCWCRVEARDSRGCDNETTLIDEASKPQTAAVRGPDESCERHSWRYMDQSISLYTLEAIAIVSK
jgi:hypothetical protein